MYHLYFALFIAVWHSLPSVFMYTIDVHDRARVDGIQWMMMIISLEVHRQTQRRREDGWF